MLNRFKEYIEKKNLIEKNEKIIIAISGGPDSVALFFLLQEIKTEYDLTLFFVHINHCLRGEESNTDEKFIKKLSEKFDIKLYSKRIDIVKKSKEEKMGLEETGRNERYKIFLEAKEFFKADKIALAHNQDDNVETFLFRLIRGSSIKGLASIPVKRERYIRPLLFLKKSEILQYLENNSLSYCIDKSNHETNYTRNKLRLHLIPEIEREYNNKLKEHISNLISDIDEVNSFFKRKLSEYAEKEDIKISDITNFTKYEQKYILNEFLSKSGITISREILTNIINIINKDGTKYIDLDSSHYLVKDYEKIYIKNSLIKTKYVEKILNINEEVKYYNYIFRAGIIGKEDMIPSKNSFYCDKEKLEEIFFTIRSRKEKDYFYLNGMKGRKSLKKFFIDEKINKEKRDKIPIITNNDNILWIVGYRYSNIYKVDENTKKIIKISFKEVANFE